MNGKGHSFRMIPIILTISALGLVVLLGLPFVRAQAEGGAGAAKEEIPEVLKTQAEAWNQGDLDKFVASYLNSPDTSYTSAGKETWGFEALKKRYEDKYGTSKESMGKLSFSELKIFELGKNNALCIGHWHLKLKEGMDGVFSLVFTRTDSGWKILHDHTSLRSDGDK